MAVSLRHRCKFSFPIVSIVSIFRDKKTYPREGKIANFSFPDMFQRKNIPFQFENLTIAAV